MTAANEELWVVERYIKNQLHYWAAGARGRGYRDDWSAEFDFATGFAREQDAMQVLLHICDGEGRVTQHTVVQK
jgi:hypothetical protein